MADRRYCISWIEWSGPEKTAHRVRRRKEFDTAEERRAWKDTEKEKDDFLYVLSEWEEDYL
jgi:hypothetical protein